MTLPPKRKAHFDEIDYHKAPVEAFTADNVQAAIKAGLQKLKGKSDALQMIFPGVRFTEANFNEYLWKMIHACFPDKHTHIIFHDSHSAGPNRGKDIHVIDGVIGKEEHADPDAITIMLYDSSNQQGGDFGRYSLFGAANSIDQLIFFNLTDGPRDPSQVATANDVYQAIRRRRGPWDRQPVVFGAANTREGFLGAVNARQAVVEKYYAATDAADKIARRLLKNVVRSRKPAFSIKGKTLRQIQEEAAKEIGMPRLAEIQLTEQIRRQLLTGITGDELRALEELSVKAPHTRDRVLLMKTEHTGRKMAYYQRWVETVK